MNMRKDCKVGDRISNLPESLLHHILSFLEIKDGARTSVLSKRWNYIWTTVPTLNFQIHRYPAPNSSETEKFMDFVDGTLDRHNLSNVDKFYLSWGGYLNESWLHSWISTLIRGNVKELILYLKESRLPNKPLFLPLSHFTCESLTSLELGTLVRLHDNFHFIFPKYISFPRLRRLTLHWIKFSDKCWNEQLFSNSPVLEELFLDFCIFRLRNFCISIPTLKHLRINNWDQKLDFGFKDCALKIDAPSLVTFTYYADLGKECILSSFPTLVEAVVCLLYSEENAAQISRLLRAIAHVKCLTVNDLLLQAIFSKHNLSNNMLKFHNVEKLNISDILSTDQGLIAFLKLVPNLESLVVEENIVDDEYMNEKHDADNNDYAEGDGDDEDADSVEGENNQNNEDVEDVSDTAECGSNGEGNDGNKDDSWALNGVPTGCLFPHLKSACFHQFSGYPREMRWMKLILRNAKALEKMSIRYGDNAYGKEKSEKELLVAIPCFPRASPGCVIKFCCRGKNPVFFR